MKNKKTVGAKLFHNLKDRAIREAAKAYEISLETVLFGDVRSQAEMEAAIACGTVAIVFGLLTDDFSPLSVFCDQYDAECRQREIPEKECVRARNKAIAVGLKKLAELYDTSTDSKEYDELLFHKKAGSN